MTEITSKTSQSIIKLGEEFRYYQHPEIHDQEEYTLLDGDGDELGCYLIGYAGNDDLEILSELILWYKNLGQYKPENQTPSKFLEVFQEIFESGIKQGKIEQLKVFKKFIQEQAK
jgi:hypothetical protein